MSKQEEELFLTQEPPQTTQQEKKMLIDVHCHLYDPRILKNDEEFTLYIEDLKKKGVGKGKETTLFFFCPAILSHFWEFEKKVIVPVEDIPSAEKVLELAKRYPNFLYPGLGLHPLSLTYKSQIKEMCDFIEQHHKEIVCFIQSNLSQFALIFTKTRFALVK